MEEEEFLNYLSHTKTVMEATNVCDSTLPQYDFFSYYDRFVKQIFKGYSQEELDSPSFKMTIHQNISQMRAMQEIKKPKKPSNIVNFIVERERLRASR